MLVDTRCGRLFVEVVGTGPDIVLWHSLLCDGGMWLGQVRGLSERYRLINIDGPGHGRSGLLRRGFSLADCVEAAVTVLDAVGAERVAWCGLSWGGMVGMRFALRHRERLAALVLMDTSARAEALEKRLAYRALATIARTVGPRRPLARVLAPIFFSPQTRRDKPQMVERFVESVSHMDRVSLGHAVDAVIFDRTDISDEIRHVDVRTLVLVGEEDRATPPREAELITRQIPGAELATIPEAGHLSALEQPGAVNAQLERFLSAHVA